MIVKVFRCIFSLAFVFCCTQANADKLPNILWLTSEDNGPHLGCYGDTYSTTPTIDALAAKGLTFLHCWSNAPVCAPARTALISGLYPTTTGSQHMRSKLPYPAGLKMYPQLLRELGYYCTNHSKEDYNLGKPDKVWDASGNKAHWQNRPSPDQPFMAVFNFGTSHESQVRNRPHTLVHDPDKAPIPPYHPDVPEVRRDWAQYYDRLTQMDKQVKRRLWELEKAGLMEDTIVFYYGDHGAGIARNKRSPKHTGLHVPLVVYIPEKFRHLAPKGYVAGTTSDLLVSFVDFAPTLVSLAGKKPPSYLHGHAFLGEHAAPEQPYIYGFRGRMDERPDLCRTVRNKKYQYIRNYLPHLPDGQHVGYMFKTNTTKKWKQLFDGGKLNAAQSHFWKERPYEELYDLDADPHQIHNLAASAEHRSEREKLSAALDQHLLATRDIGFLPEGEIHSRSQGTTPYAIGQDSSKYDFSAIHNVAVLAASREMDALPELIDALDAEDSAIRYWAAMGLRIRGEKGFAAGEEKLLSALRDPSPYVRIVAAETLGMFGDPQHTAAAMQILLKEANIATSTMYCAIPALNAIDALDARAGDHLAAIKALPHKRTGSDQRFSSYPGRLLDKITADLTDLKE